ncbi:MAG: hypothetical protein Q4F11_04810 [Eubacteriales bacterium]|nr:hypothetical protein [Eubacteriales bacterium]
MIKLKKLLGVLIASMLTVGTIVTPVYAEYIVTGYSAQLCYNADGQYMGGAQLSCDFEYVDGDYVVDRSVSTFYSAELSNSDCLFSDVKSDHSSSGSYAYGKCSYYASDDVYFNYGYLETECDNYGNIQDNGKCIARGYVN